MIRQKILQQLPEGLSAILSTLFQSKISHRNLATADATSSFCSEISCMCLWENTFANEGFVVPPFLSDSPRNLCLILHSLYILTHSSHSAANLKVIRLLSREYRHRDYWDLANIFLLFNTSTAKDGVDLPPYFQTPVITLTHYWPAAADIPVASDNPVHYADAIRYNASNASARFFLLPLTRLV